MCRFPKITIGSPTRNPLADCCTHFVSTHAYENEPAVRLATCAATTHNRMVIFIMFTAIPRPMLGTWSAALRVLRRRGLRPDGFAAPDGRWNPGLDDAVASLGYEYSSEFQLGYDDLPFFPWKHDRFSRVLQVPVHPVCEGLFLDSGVQGSRGCGRLLEQDRRGKDCCGEPALVYGHPERRLGKMPDRDHPAPSAAEVALVWRATLTDLCDRGAGVAVESTWCSPARASVSRFISTSGTRNTLWPWRFSAAASVALCPYRVHVRSSRWTSWFTSDARSPEIRSWWFPGLTLDTPGSRPPHAGLDWETVTPPHELSAGSLAGSFKDWRAGGSSSKQGLVDVSYHHHIATIRRDQPVLAEATLPGSVSHRFGAAACPFVRVPGSRRGRKPAHPDGPSPRGDGPACSAFLPLDRSARTAATASSVRDVSRRSGVGKSGQGSRNAGCALAYLLVPASSPLEPGTHRVAKDRSPGIVVAARLVPQTSGLEAELLALCDRILPNSHAEARQLSALFGMNPERIEVIPNGVLSTFREASPVLFRERFGPGEFVLFVGRVEPRKNPLVLSGRPIARLALVILAPPLRSAAATFNGAGRQAAMRCLGYPRQTTKILCSHRLTLRLVCWLCPAGSRPLGWCAQAALARTAVVITPFGSTREYFGERVLYARPDRAGEIKIAIARGWSEGPDPCLAGFVASHYLWPRIAERTAEVYGKLAS